MRLLNVAGRMTIELADQRGIDVEIASEGRFGPGPMQVFEHWGEFVTWADQDLSRFRATAIDPTDLEPPSPTPRQVFAIGLNYRAHAAEGGVEAPETPVVFTKFPSSVTGPGGTIGLPPGAVDFEVELVAVVGRTTTGVAEGDGWSWIAGLTLGQDLSHREQQFAGPAPQQFSLAKSHRGFAPTGPALVTLDEFDDPDDVGIECELNGTLVQSGRTSDTIFTVPAIVAYLSSMVTLYPGDLIFTGTPPGVGWAREPKLLLRAGDTLISRAERIGRMLHTF